MENKNPVSRSNIHTLEIPPKRVYKKMCVFIAKYTIVNMTLIYLIVTLIRWHQYSIVPLREFNCEIGLFLPCVHIGQKHMEMRYTQAHFCVRILCVANVRFLCKDSLWTWVTILWVPDVRFSRRAILENSVLINFVFEH